MNTYEIKFLNDESGACEIIVNGKKIPTIYSYDDAMAQIELYKKNEE